MKVTNNGKSVVVDQEFIGLGESGNGGWNKKQLAIIGVDWPPEKGWKFRVHGSIISYESALEFIRIKGKKTNKGKKKDAVQSKAIFVKTKKDLSWRDQYRHPNWQKLRLVILKRDNFSCCECGDEQSQLHVHHLKYPKGKKIWGAKHSDLITLCESCHLKVHKRKSFYNEKKVKSKIKKR